MAVTPELRDAVLHVADTWSKIASGLGRHVTPSLASLPLVQPFGLVYQGAFKVPSDSFRYAWGSLAYDAAHNSLFLVGSDWGAELTIPTPRTSSSATALLRATLIQSGKLTDGLLESVNPMSVDPNPKAIGGVLVADGRLLVSGFSTYDGGGTQTRSHFTRSRDLATAWTTQGPFPLTIQQPAGTARTLGAGFVSAYMCPVPPEWQARLGGPALTGNCCQSILSRTSFGPAAFAFDPARVGSATPAPAVPLVCYPDDHPNLCEYGTVTPVMGGVGIAEVKAMAFPDHTRSVLFFGRVGTDPVWKYGQGTNIKALDGTPVPGVPLDGNGQPVRYYYDPEQVDWKGGHGWPYAYRVWAYDALELAQVKAGTRKPWDVRPYAYWPLTFPFSAWFTHITGAAFDPATGRLFLVQAFGEQDSPVIHVYTVQP